MDAEKQLVEKFHPDEIIVRPFRPEDNTQIRKIFFTGLVDGVASAGRFVLDHAFIRWPLMYMAYLCSILGTTIALSFPGIIRVIGVALVISSFAFMRYVYCRLRAAFVSFYCAALQDDLADITSHYMTSEKGLPSYGSCFWVAEVPSLTSEGGYEVVGCVALDSSTNDDPMTGELRRMFVLPAYRKRGVGSKLIYTLVENAKQHNMSYLYLETTNFQPVACLTYNKLGWTHTATRRSDFEGVGLKMDFLQYSLSL